MTSRDGLRLFPSAADIGRHSTGKSPEEAGGGKQAGGDRGGEPGRIGGRRGTGVGRGKGGRRKF